MSKKQRKFTPEFKAQVVLEVLSGERSATDLCRQYQLRLDTLSRWKSEFLSKAATVFGAESQEAEQQARIEELERLIGRLTVELEVAKKASRLGSRR